MTDVLIFFLDFIILYSYFRSSHTSISNSPSHTAAAVSSSTLRGYCFYTRLIHLFEYLIVSPPFNKHKAHHPNTIFSLEFILATFNIILNTDNLYYSVLSNFSQWKLLSFQNKDVNCNITKIYLSISLICIYENLTFQRGNIYFN